MSFGIGVGDLALLVSTAWNLYRAVKDGPEGLKEAQSELLGLHIALKELREDADESTLQNQHLVTLIASCEDALTELELVVAKYTRISRDKSFKGVPGRLRLSGLNIQPIRDKLVMHINSLNLYINSLGKSALARIERKLDLVLRTQQSTGNADEYPEIWQRKSRFQSSRPPSYTERNEPTAPETTAEDLGSMRLEDMFPSDLQERTPSDRASFMPSQEPTGSLQRTSSLASSPLFGREQSFGSRLERTDGARQSTVPDRRLSLLLSPLRRTGSSASVSSLPPLPESPLPERSTPAFSPGSERVSPSALAPYAFSPGSERVSPSALAPYASHSRQPSWHSDSSCSLLSLMFSETRSSYSSHTSFSHTSAGEYRALRTESWSSSTGQLPCHSLDDASPLRPRGRILEQPVPEFLQGIGSGGRSAPRPPAFGRPAWGGAQTVGSSVAVAAAASGRAEALPISIPPRPRC